MRIIGAGLLIAASKYRKVT